MKNAVRWLCCGEVVLRVHAAFLVGITILVLSLATKPVVLADEYDCKMACRAAYDAAVQANADAERQAIEQWTEISNGRQRIIRLAAEMAEKECRLTFSTKHTQLLEDYLRGYERCAEDVDICHDEVLRVFAAALIACQVEPTPVCESLAVAYLSLSIAACDSKGEVCAVRNLEDYSRGKTRAEEDLGKCLKVLRDIEDAQLMEVLAEFGVIVAAAQELRRVSDELAVAHFVLCVEGCPSGE